MREDGDPPRIVRAASPAEPGRGPSAEATVVERDAVGTGNVAVICPTSMVDARGRSPSRRPGSSSASRPRSGLDLQVTVVPVGMVKGLEVDASVVVEPAGIVAEEAQGHRALYVALTRSTKRLCLVHADPLPEALPLTTCR